MVKNKIILFMLLLPGFKIQSKHYIDMIIANSALKKYQCNLNWNAGILKKIKNVVRAKEWLHSSKFIKKEVILEMA